MNIYTYIGYYQIPPGDQHAYVSGKETDFLLFQSFGCMASQEQNLTEQINGFQRDSDSHAVFWISTIRFYQSPCNIFGDWGLQSPLERENSSGHKRQYNKHNYMDCVFL